MPVRDMDRSRLGWWVLAAVFAATIGYIVYSFLGTFVFGVFLYYATRPVYRRLNARTSHSNVAAAISLFALALPALLLLAYTVAVGLGELNAFLETQEASFGQFQTLLEPYFDISSAIDNPRAILGEPSIRQALLAILGDLSKYLGFIGTAALHLFIMITLAFYLLRDDHRIATWFHRRFSDTDGVVEAYGRVVDRDFSNIFFGNILNAFFTGIIGAISYSAINYVSPAGVSIPYPFLLGLLTGVASLVPVVGIKLVYVPIAILVSIQTGGDPALLWFPILFVIVSFVIVDVIPDLVLRPYVSGRGLHLGMVMLAYIFGPLLFGWYGIFLGPMILVLFVHFVRLVLPELLAGKPIEPEAVGPDLWTGTNDSSAVQDTHIGTEGRDATESNGVPLSQTDDSTSGDSSGTSSRNPSDDRHPDADAHRAYDLDADSGSDTDSDSDVEDAPESDSGDHDSG